MENADQETAPALERDAILNLNFVPAWARQPPKPFEAARFPNTEEERSARGGDRPRPSGRRGPREDGDSRVRRDRPARPSGRDSRDGQTGREPRAESRPPRDAGARPPAPEAERQEPRSGPPRPMDRPEWAPVHVRFFPDQARMVAAARKIHSTRRAYPLLDLAALFLGGQDACGVKIEVEPDRPDVRLFQCGLCRVAALDREALFGHIVKDHLDDFFTKEETLGDPPGGDFPCVARCGLSGILLGPPNHHGYSARMREIHRGRYPNMPFEQYQRRIETLRDPQLVEQWKEESRRVMHYRLKDAPADSEPLTWAAAEAYMADTVAAKHIASSRTITMSLQVARRIEDPRLRASIASAWRREDRNPIGMARALRAAFPHKRLFVFRSGPRGDEFVTSIKPVPLDPADAVNEIARILTHLGDHPGCKRADLLGTLLPGVEPTDPATASVTTPLGWLIEKGHIIEFFDGSLAVPMSGRGGPLPATAPVTPNAPADGQ